MKRSVAILMSAALSLLALGCGEPELATVGVRSVGAQLTIETIFTEETRFTVGTDQDSTCLIITAPNAVISERIPRERLIDSIDMISGWFVKPLGKGVEMRFYLTGKYPFKHTAAVIDKSGRFGVRLTVEAKPDSVVLAEKAHTDSIAAAALLPSSLTAPTPLLKGIALYREGKHDEALESLKTAIDRGGKCPLAYYYAARIRLVKEQYARALVNFESAMSDSAGFSEAAGYRAYTLKKMGRNSEALAEWKRYVGSVTQTPPAGTFAASAITTPEMFRAALGDTAALSRNEAARLRDSAAAHVTPADSLRATPVIAHADSDSTAVAAANNTIGGEVLEGDFSAVDNRIKWEIRKGLIGIAAALVLLMGGFAVTVYWLRKRSAARPEKTFAREIVAMTGGKAGEFDLEEEASARLFEEKRRIIAGEEAEAVPEEPEEAAPIPSFVIPPLQEPTHHEQSGAMRAHFLEDTGGRHPITEEIKALVARMHREGRSVEEICRAAELTRTEVELIIAVRARHMEQLIEYAADTVEEEYDPDHLVIAIRELSADGAKPRDIARKLGVSTSEVTFALAVMENERKSRNGK